MATSRTGTAQWKRLRAEVIHEAKGNGLKHCPICRVYLDWNSAKKPRSVEVDHKIAVSRGGSDDPSNLHTALHSSHRA